MLERRARPGRTCRYKREGDGQNSSSLPLTLSQHSLGLIPCHLVPLFPLPSTESGTHPFTHSLTYIFPMPSHSLRVLVTLAVLATAMLVETDGHPLPQPSPHFAKRASLVSTSPTPPLPIILQIRRTDQVKRLIHPGEIKPVPVILERALPVDKRDNVHSHIHSHVHEHVCWQMYSIQRAPC